MWGPGASSTALHRASTALVHGLTRSLAVDRGPAVRCDVQPACIMTGMSDDASALARDPGSARRHALARRPVGRSGEPVDVADAVAWPAATAAWLVTGRCCTVDGGPAAASAVHPGLS